MIGPVQNIKVIIIIHSNFSDHNTDENLVKGIYSLIKASGVGGKGGVHVLVIQGLEAYNKV